MSDTSRLTKLRSQVNDAVVQQLNSASRFYKAFQGVFILAAVAVAGVCQYTTWPDQGSPSISQIIGIVATIVVFLASLISLMGKRGSTEVLSTAQRAVHQTEVLQERLDRGLREWPDVEAMVALHSATSLFRDVLESAAAQKASLSQVLENMVGVVERTLPAAAAFTYSDPWTICLYKADLIDSSNDRHELKLVEHLRAIKCDKSSARAWPEGRGVSGVAFSNSSEIQIPDMTEASAVALYQSAGNVKSYDADRYRSMIVVPIKVQGMSKPWGVVAATSSSSYHFNDDDETGLKPAEAIRALANYAALAVAMCKDSPSSEEVQSKSDRK